MASGHWSGAGTACSTSEGRATRALAVQLSEQVIGHLHVVAVSRLARGARECRRPGRGDNTAQRSLARGGNVRGTHLHVGLDLVQVEQLSEQRIVHLIGRGHLADEAARTGAAVINRLAPRHKYTSLGLQRDVVPSAARVGDGSGAHGDASLLGAPIPIQRARARASGPPTRSGECAREGAEPGRPHPLRSCSARGRLWYYGGSHALRQSKL